MNIDLIKEHLHIVFGAEHYNPLGLVRSLGENGIKPICIIVRNNRPITSKSKYIEKLFLVDSIEEGYDLLIKEYGQEKIKPFVYTSDDKITSYLDERYNEISDKFFFFNAGKNGQINRFMDKYNICEMAKKHGLPLAKTWRVEKGEIPADIEYPIITKSIASIVGGWKSDVFVCHSEQELKEAFTKISAPTVLLQKYIDKKNELEYYGFCIDKGRQTFISTSVDYLYLLPNTYSHYMTVYNPKYPDIQEKIAEMMQEIGFDGIFSLEFVVDKEDNLYFLEVNFRNATWSYASTRAGMPLPILWAESTLIGNVSHIKRIPIKNNFRAMVEPDYFRYMVRKTKKVSLGQFLKQITHCDCLYYLNRKDMLPVISWVLHKNGGH